MKTKLTSFPICLNITRTRTKSYSLVHYKDMEPFSYKVVNHNRKMKAKVLLHGWGFFVKVVCCSCDEKRKRLVQGGGLGLCLANFISTNESHLSTMKAIDLHRTLYSSCYFS